MNRIEFMRQMERLLWDIPENDRLDAIAYYNDYFDEAGKENEEKVIRELGSPEKVAANIKADLHTTGNKTAEYTKQGYSDGRESMDQNVPARQEKRKIPLALIIILLVLASPMIIGIGTGILGVLFGLIAGVFGIFIAIAVCGITFPAAGIVCFVVGVIRVVLNPLEGLVTIGIGALFIAIGLLFLVLSAWIIFKWLPALFRICVDACRKIFGRVKRRSAE